MKGYPLRFMEEGNLRDSNLMSRDGIYSIQLCKFLSIYSLLENVYLFYFKKDLLKKGCLQGPMLRNGK